MTDDIDVNLIFKKNEELTNAMARLFESGKITSREYTFFTDSIVQAPLEIKMLMSIYAVNDEVLLALLNLHPRYESFKSNMSEEELNEEFYSNVKYVTDASLTTSEVAIAIKLNVTGRHRDGRTFWRSRATFDLIAKILSLGRHQVNTGM